QISTDLEESEIKTVQQQQKPLVDMGMSNNNDGNLNAENPNHRRLNRTQQSPTLSMLKEINSSTCSNNKVHSTGED
ncbi:hypothetical protein A2U01_0060022, partial [Trifolium medium]|nr:hypothetical protein [Trifolium medium]